MFLYQSLSRIWITFDWGYKNERTPLYTIIILWYKSHVIMAVPSHREGWKQPTVRSHILVCPPHLTPARVALSLNISRVPPAPLGPQLKTPLMSSNWQRLHHFHTSLSTESGIKMLEAEWTIDFLLLFLCVSFGCSVSSPGPSTQCGRNLGAILSLQRCVV